MQHSQFSQFAKYLDSLKVNQPLSITQLIDQIIEQYQLQIGNLLDHLSNIMIFGPIALISPEKLNYKKQFVPHIQQLRIDYETYCGLIDIKIQPNQIFLEELRNAYQKNMNQSLTNTSYAQFLTQLKEQNVYEQLDKNSFVHILAQLMDPQTIQEIAQTQIEWKNDSESDGAQQKERKSLFNYDGDEERTPIQSEQEESIDQTKDIQKNKKKIEKQQEQTEQQEQLSDEDGYDASNSDHKMKTTKSTRNPRVIQRRKNNNQNPEFDTDRETKQKQ